MSDSDDENVLYAPTGKNAYHQGKGLLGNGVKNVNDIINGPTEPRRLKKTIALCMAFLGLGLALAVVGPTLKELQHHFHVDFPKVSFIFTGRSIGYVFGSIIGGMTFDSFHPLLMIALTLGLSGIGLLVTPYCQQLLVSVLAISFVGLAMGALDTGANVVCLRMWGKKSAPFMQALHFSFALGAFVAPLLAGPFIGPSVPLTTTMANIRPSVQTNPSSPVPMSRTSLFVSGTASLQPTPTSELILSISSSPSATSSSGTLSSSPVSSSLAVTASTSKPSVVPSATKVILQPTSTSIPAITSSSATTTLSSSAVAAVSSATAASSAVSSATASLSTSAVAAMSKAVVSSTPALPLQTSTSKPSSSSSAPITPKEEVRKRRDIKLQSRRLLSQPKEKENGEEKEHLNFHAEDNIDALGSKRKKRHWRSRIMLEADSGDTETETKTEPKERFQGVYIIIAVFLMLMGLVFTYFFCMSPPHFKPTQSDNNNLGASFKVSEKNFTHYILGLLFIFYFLYVGGEVGYGGFIYSFAVDNKNNLNFTSDDATHLNSLFWGTFALGRGVSICMASLISPLNMVLLDIVGCIVSSMALAYQANVNVTVLWVGTATLGASMASLFPAGISWLESHAPVTGNMASLLIIGAAFGEMAVPLLLGYLFDSNVGPMSLMYVVFAISVATAGIFGCTVYLAAKEGRSYDPLPKEDVLEELIMEVRSAIDDEDDPSKAKQASKPFLPKPLQLKKHKE